MVLQNRLDSFRWRIASLLCVGVLVNYLDRVNLSVSHAALHNAFGLSDITFGYLSGAYNWTYAACQLPVGVLLDRFGVRRVGRVSIFVWSVASFLAAITPNLPGFFGARLLLGVGEAPTFPASAKAVGLWFPDRERGTATALFDAAAKLASALGVPLLGIFLLSLGWRWTFAITGLISLLYFGLFTATYRDPEWLSDATLSGPELAAPELAAQGSGSSLSYLLRSRKVLGLALGMGAYNYVFYLLITWLPTYLSSILHVDLLHSFLYSGVPWLFATCTDLAAGLGTDRLIQRGWDASRVRRAVLLGGTACGLGVLGAAQTHSPATALAWISLSIGGLSAASPIGWAIPSLIAPRNSTGKVGGIMNFSNQLSGIAAPIVTGYIFHLTHSFAWAFGLSASYLFVGLLGYGLLLGKIERISPEAFHAAA